MLDHLSEIPSPETGLKISQKYFGFFFEKYYSTV
jgi:hypothetical protein